MASISVLQIARGMKASSLLGIAKDVGVNPPPPPISARSLLSRRAFNSDFITTNQPLGGTVTVHADSQGEITINGSFHDSGFDNIDYTVTVVIVTPTFRAFTFQHSGHTEGTSGNLLGHPNRDDNFTVPTALNPLTAGAFWPDFYAGTITGSAAATDTLVNGLEGALNTLLDEALKAAGQALGKAGAAAIISLV